MADESLAFAMNDYEVWAADLAEAAKRTLEEPVMRKGKGKDDDEDEGAVLRTNAAACQLHTRKIDGFFWRMK